MKLIAHLGDIDRRTTAEFGIAPRTLMETAGRRMADHILSAIGTPANDRAVVLCGPGNNGGDGYVVARLLYGAGLKQLHVMALDADLSDDALANRERLPQEISILTLTDDTLSQARSLITETDIVIDALFGSGLSRPVAGVAAELIHTLNTHPQRAEQWVVAVDIPSGIDGRTGNILGIAVQANETVTFATGKPGLYLADGRDATGEISVVDIGIPVQLIAEDDGLTCLMDTAMAAKALPERRPNSHKYTYGHVLVVAGSHAMPGAGRLVSEAALQSGCGLVTLAAPPQVLQSVGLLPEILHAPLTANPAGHSQPAALEALLNDTERMAKVSVVAIGPGLGKDDDTAACLQLLLTHTAMAGKVLIVDADALHLLAAKPVPTKERTPAALILTPHLGEARALLSGNLPADLITTATTIAQRYEAIAVLKTAGTITAGPGGRTIINPTGNPGMATAGSGDVLTGILSGLLAQTVASGAVTPERLFSTVALGVYLHGLAGDAAADETTPYCLIASDITAGLPQAFEAVLSARTQPRSLEAHR